MVKPIRARRFRAAFWVVVTLGALPAAVSGVALVGRYATATLCAPMRPLEGAAELAVRLRWERVHDWGRWGAMLAGLLVVAYGSAWAFEAGLTRARRALMVGLLAGVLLPSLGAAVWTGRALPWRLFGPMVWLGDLKDAPAVLFGRSTEESGGPAWCAEHAREVGRLRAVWWAHVAAGGLALALMLALCDAAARWRGARDQREGDGRPPPRR
jgi:hypothetical protein